MADRERGGGAGAARATTAPDAVGSDAVPGTAALAATVPGGAAPGWPSGVNLPALRGHNTALVLDLLRVAGPAGISRRELADRTGLTPQAVSKITARLRAEGLAAPAGRRASTGGKPPTALRLVPGARHAVGLHLDRDACTAVLVDLTGTVVAERHGPLDLGAGADVVVDLVVREVRALTAAVRAGGPGTAGQQHATPPPGPGGPAAAVGLIPAGAPAPAGEPAPAGAPAPAGEWASAGEWAGSRIQAPVGERAGFRTRAPAGERAGLRTRAPAGEPATVRTPPAPGDLATPPAPGDPATPPAPGDPATVAVPFPPAGVLGVGVAVPGPLDHRLGVLHRVTGFPEWDGFPLRDVLARRLGLPVAVDKDTNAAALGLSLSMGAGQSGAHSFAYLHLGTGLGAGLVLDGAVRRGARTGAGEFGHQVILLDGPRCSCGNHGCVEALCLDAVARGEIGTAARVLGEGAANLIALLDVDRVLLGGATITADPGTGERFVRGVAAALVERARRAGCDRAVPVAIAPGGPRTVAEGAAQLLLAPLLGRAEAPPAAPPAEPQDPAAPSEASPDPAG